MSLLDRSNTTVVVHAEIETTDSDGNPVRKPDPVGVTKRATVQPMGKTQTDDMDDMGFVTDEYYRLRLARGEHIEIGARGYIVWNGRKYGVIGEPRRYIGSSRTAHTDYVIKRS